MVELVFETREDFHSWLLENAGNSGGVWLVFGKNQSVNTLKASEALEEALCFGWIDGQMQKIDDSRYLKYFAPRRKDSPWSEKNRGLAEALIAQGKMMPQGLKRIDEAKADGRWNTPKRAPISEKQVTGHSRSGDSMPACILMLNRMKPVPGGWKRSSGGSIKI